MDADFTKIVDRAAVLRLTENELVEMVHPPISRATYWRAKTGKTGLSARVKVLRRIEEKLDALEAER